MENKREEEEEDYNDVIEYYNALPLPSFVPYPIKCITDMTRINTYVSSTTKAFLVN